MEWGKTKILKNKNSLFFAISVIASKSEAIQSLLSLLLSKVFIFCYSRYSRKAVERESIKNKNTFFIFDFMV